MIQNTFLSIQTIRQNLGLKIFFILAVLTVSGFFIFTTELHRVTFYAMLISGLFCFKIHGKKPLLMLASGILKQHAYMLVTIGLFLILNAISFIWSSHQNIESLITAVKIPIFIGLFLLLFSYSIAKHPVFKTSVEICYILCALFSALFLILLNYASFSISDIGHSFRIQGTGRAENSNVYAQTISVAILMLLFSPGIAIKTVQIKKYRAILTPLVFIILLFTVALTGGRGPALALAVALFATALISKNKIALFLTVGAGLLCISVITIYPEIIENIAKRGDTYRFMIWDQTWEYIKQAPILGHGITTEFSFPINPAQNHYETSSHNIILGTLLYNGALGATLLITIYIQAFSKAFRIGNLHNNWLPFSLLVFGITVLQFSGHTLFLNLNPEWLFIWLPIAYIFSYKLDEATQDKNE